YPLCEQGASPQHINIIPAQREIFIEAAEWRIRTAVYMGWSLPRRGLSDGKSFSRVIKCSVEFAWMMPLYECP
ncbi:hypothetical protein P692DRAFT_20834485, partial [Suillus brevipes Sb2]